MTLSAYLSQFYLMLKNVVVRDQDGARAFDLGKDIPKPAAVEYLNLGWKYAAEDVGGLYGSYDDTLVESQSEYIVPNEVIKVKLVRLLDDSTLMAEMIPTEYTDVVGKDDTDEITDAVPDACSVVLAKFQDSNEAQRCLKLNCPPNWGGEHYIEVYCTRVPQFITAETQTPDLPHTLGQAGLFRACLLATGDMRFQKLYEDARNVYLRTGVNLQPLTPKE